MLYKFQFSTTQDCVHPEFTIETIFTGVAEVEQDENGCDDITPLELYRNGECVRIYPPDGKSPSQQWRGLVTMIENAVWDCMDDQTQQRIKLPTGNAYDAQFPPKPAQGKSNAFLLHTLEIVQTDAA